MQSKGMDFFRKIFAAFNMQRGVKPMAETKPEIPLILTEPHFDASLRLQNKPATGGFGIGMRHEVTEVDPMDELYAEDRKFKAVMYDYYSGVELVAGYGPSEAEALMSAQENVIDLFIAAKNGRFH